MNVDFSFSSSSQSFDADFGTVTTVLENDHAELENLDYANSGHTGFASSAALENKVDKVSGKGLSTNDYDDNAVIKVNESYTAKHSHDNKALLDTYTQTESNLSDAVSKKHEHDNKSVIDAISSSTVSAWNAKYDKPDTGIPKSDLAFAVQSSLGLADTALQEHQSLSAYRTSAAQDVIDATHATNAALAVTNRSLDALWKLSEGQVYEFETDSNAGYQKTVPTGGHYASVEKIGGKTVVWNNIIGNSYTDGAWGTSGTASGVSYTVSNTGYLTLSGTTTNGYNFVLATGKTVYANHVYIVLGTDAFANFNPIMYDTQQSVYIARDWCGNAPFVVSTNSTHCNIYLNQGYAGQTVSYTGKPMMFDLTQMFGVTTTSAVTDEMKAFCTTYASANPAYNAGELVSGKCDKVTYTDTESVATDYAISATTQALEGYGWSAGTAYNYVNFERKKFVKQVGCVDLGTLGWSKASSTYIVFAASLTSVLRTANAVCPKYDVTDEIGYASMEDKHFSFNGTVIRIKDTDYADAAAFKAAMSGVMLYYELAAPTETDITDTVFDEPFAVGTGGTLTMHQQDDTRLPLPNTEEYIIKLDEVST